MRRVPIGLSPFIPRKRTSKARAFTSAKCQKRKSCSKVLTKAQKFQQSVLNGCGHCDALLLAIIFCCWRVVHRPPGLTT